MPKSKAPTDEEIAEWTSQASWRTFASEADARSYLFDTREYVDRQFGGMFKKFGKASNRAFAQAMPVWGSGRSWHVGNRPKKQVGIDWSKVTITPTKRWDLEGVIDVERDRLGPVKMVDVATLTKTERHADTAEGKVRVATLARYLRDDPNPELPAIVCEEDGAIVDGHHRLDAVKLLKSKTIPAQRLIRG